MRSGSTRFCGFSRIMWDSVLLCMVELLADLGSKIAIYHFDASLTQLSFKKIFKQEKGVFAEESKVLSHGFQKKSQSCQKVCESNVYSTIFNAFDEMVSKQFNYSSIEE